MTETIDNTPCIAYIYPMQLSVKKAFGIEPNLSTNSNFSSESSSSNSANVDTTTTTSFSCRQSRPHPHFHPCLLWNQTAEHCTVLLFTTFNLTDPMKADDSGKSIISHLTPDQLAKRLVAIAPTKPLIGRPSISFNRLPDIGDNVVV